MLLVWGYGYSQKSLKPYQTFVIEGHKVDVALPPDTVPVKGNLVILQGWNFPKEDWCLKSSLCKEARLMGLILIMPEMGKSTYQSHNYPQTRKDWLMYPTRKWLTDQVFTFLQNEYGILTQNQKNFMVGLSTGARGVLLVTLDFPNLFSAVAALSGDFDQTLIPHDGVMRGFYGEYAQFPNRWKYEDNVIYLMKNFSTPIYIGHGKKDNVIPANQSEILFQHIHKINPALDVILHIAPDAKHDYTYWDSEVKSILQFFQKYL